MASKSEGQCLQIKWSIPDETGGLPILQYELQIADDAAAAAANPVCAPQGCNLLPSMLLGGMLSLS